MDILSQKVGVSVVINTNFSVGDKVYYCVPERIKVVTDDGRNLYVLTKKPMDNESLVEGVVFNMYWDKSVNLQYMLREIIGDSYSSSFPVREEDVFSTMQECALYCQISNADWIQEAKENSLNKQ